MQGHTCINKYVHLEIHVDFLGSLEKILTIWNRSRLPKSVSTIESNHSAPNPNESKSTIYKPRNRGKQMGYGSKELRTKRLQTTVA